MRMRRGVRNRDHESEISVVNSHPCGACDLNDEASRAECRRRDRRPTLSAPIRGGTKTGAPPRVTTIPRRFSAERDAEARRGLACATRACVGLATLVQQLSRVSAGPRKKKKKKKKSKRGTGVAR